MTPATSITTTTAALYHQQDRIEALAYSFSPYNERSAGMTPQKVFLDILFVHPRSAETITLRSVVHAKMLCGKREDVEAMVHREIQAALHFNSAGIM